MGVGAALSGLGLTSTAAYDTVEAPRGVSLGSVSDTNGYVGMDIASSVTKNTVSDLVQVTNNTSTTQSITVSLVNGDGGATSDLYYAGSNQGDAVTVSVDPGNSKVVQVETSLSDGSVLDFNVSASSASFSFSADRTTDVVAGNNQTAVQINGFSDLSINTGADEFTVGKAMGKDKDGDDDLALATFTVFDSNDDQVGETTDSSELNAQNSQYKLNGGNESITFSATEDVVAGETYTFRFKLEDADGNYATSYVDVTA